MMSAVKYEVTRISSFQDQAHLVRWGDLKKDDEGAPLEIPGSTSRSIQVSGLFGSDCFVEIVGSNDGVDYFTLSDHLGNELRTRFPKLSVVCEGVRYIRPIVIGGDESTQIHVTLLFGRIK